MKKIQYTTRGVLKKGSREKWRGRNVKIFKRKFKSLDMSPRERGPSGCAS